MSDVNINLKLHVTNVDGRHDDNSCGINSSPSTDACLTTVCCK